MHYSGHVQVIGDAATNQFALLPDPNPSGNFTKITQRIPVRIAIDHGAKPRLAPGMMVVVDIDITGDGSIRANQQQRPIRTRHEQLAPPTHNSRPAAADHSANRTPPARQSDASESRVVRSGLQLSPAGQLD